MEYEGTFSAPRKKGKKGPVLLLLLFLAAGGLVFFLFFSESRVDKARRLKLPDWVDIQLIDTDGHARTGEALTDISGIVIHYIGNPGTTAQQNRNYFNSPDTKVSAHFVIGLEGEILQCIPLWERSAASNQRNPDTISIEVCHPDETGEFTPQSYASLVKLTAWLMEEFRLDASGVIRHHDITGKNCPKYFVHNKDAWDQFRRDIREG